MVEFSKQGTLATLGTVIHTGAASESFTSKVALLRFNNPLAYCYDGTTWQNLF